MRNLNGARLAALYDDAQLASVATVYGRLMRLYQIIHRRWCLVVQRLPSDLLKKTFTGLNIPVYDLLQLGKMVSKSIRSVNARRMQTKGMPTGGWDVDTRSKSSSCAYNRKRGLCYHN
ncbi:LOW QUALITY PROTEIN: hypothetical protein PHMEG_00018039 [Phytophthora megakarya]|uniref:Uncharacterized protein n=1 Tax=Phytophthora megakarya TaxID=4795 RepID=A0A225VWK6_9STRA|nr:LOW QUALITY PROTEIN: hypothetical protein PHMEG_00018039 [Phytophthora megakarya]